MTKYVRAAKTFEIDLSKFLHYAHIYLSNSASPPTSAFDTKSRIYGINYSILSTKRWTLGSNMPLRK